MDIKITVLDTETAGVTPPEYGSGVCDIAIVHLDGDLNTVWESESLIDPECKISPEAMGVHHITPEMVFDQPTLAEYMDLNQMPMMNSNIICGHNVQFDIRFTRDYLPDNFKVLDTLKLARITWPELESHKLQTIRYTFGLYAGNAHRAMGDVVTTISLLKYLCCHYKTNLDGLIQLMNVPLSLDTKMSFGKHKGEKLKDLPLNYVRWLVEKADIEPDLREALVSRL